MSRHLELHVYYPAEPTRPPAGVIRALIEDFHRAHPGIRVTTVFPGGYGDTWRTVQAAMAAREPVDITVVYSGMLRTLVGTQLVGTQMVEPLDTFIGATLLKDFLPGAMMNARVDGRIYGLPFRKSTYLLFYNRSAFGAAGVNPDTPPQTWEDLAEIARRLTVRDGTRTERWGLELPREGLTAILQSFIVQQGTALCHPGGTRVHLNTHEARRALTFLAELSHRDHVMPPDPPPLV